MRHIMNYLTRQDNSIHSVLLLTPSGSLSPLTKYLTDLGITTVNGMSDCPEIVDAVIFEEGCAQSLTHLPRTKYLIGCLAAQEDYFPLWEKYRMQVSHICLQRVKELTPDEIRDGEDPYEVLEWERSADAMESSIELSVILPTYNVARYLPKCIETLTVWQAPYVEYIFVNDGSTDESAEIIQKYAAQDARIRLLSKENGGCASARNAGIRAARGHYIGFVDPDDFIDETMFYKLFKKALMGSFELVYCGYNEYYEDTDSSAPVLNDTLSEPYSSGTYRLPKVRKLVVNTRVAIWRCIYARTLFTQHGLAFHEDLKRYDDLPFRVEAIFLARSAACVPEHLYYYRLGRAGQDVGCTDERLWVHFDIFRHLEDYVLPMNDQSLTDYLQVIKVQTHGYALGRIEKKLYKTYRKQAIADLNRTGGFWRTMLLMFLYRARGHMGWYIVGKMGEYNCGKEN